MVTHSTFHIWFGFSCTPKIKVITAVCTRKQRGQCLSEEHFCLGCVVIFVVESRCLGINARSYLNNWRTRKTKPDMKTRMINRQFGIQFVMV